MQLPLECIESILDQLEAWEFFPLLIVSRVFFRSSVKRLYASPIRRFTRFDKDRHPGDNADARFRAQLQAARRLLALIVCYSPALDPDVQSLRLILSAELEVLPEKPTLDYISLIKALHYNERYFGYTTARALCRSLGLMTSPLCIEKGLYNVLTWAACGHRLSDMLEVGILWDDLDRYHRCIDNMASMRSIRLHMAPAPSREARWRTAAEIDTASRLLNDTLRFMEKWTKTYSKRGKSRRHSRLDIQLTINDDGAPMWWAVEPYSHTLQRIFGLMPTSNPTELSSQNTFEWARFCFAPETLDLSSVRSFLAVDTEMTFPWPAQVSMSTLLQRLRNLRLLDLTTCARIDDDLFQWAHDERQRTASALTSGTGTDPLVPLSELNLRFYDFVPWQSAIYGFGATLTVLQVDGGGGNRVDLCLFHDMPQLHKLHLRFDYIDYSTSATPFSGCPRLEVLLLSCRNDGYQAFDPWDLPNLKQFTMIGSLCSKFHQATLQTMNRLEYLRFCMDGSSDPVIWDMALWKCASLPDLKVIVLDGVPAHVFAWEMLDQCPAIQRLYLEADEYVQEQPELDSQRWPWPLAPRPTLQKLRLCGFAIPQQPYIDGLPQVVPNLTTLELIGCVEMSDLQQRALRAKFPRLQELIIK